MQKPKSVNLVSMWGTWGVAVSQVSTPRLSFLFRFKAKPQDIQYTQTGYKEFLHQKQKEEVEKEEDRDSRGPRPLTPIRFYLIDREQSN